MDGNKRLDNLLRHITHVRDNCQRMGVALIQGGEEELGRQLIANGHIHDQSKFRGIEWEYLNDGAWPWEGANPQEEEMFRAALRQHVLTNAHHPEFHKTIFDMGRIHLLECVADWAARSAEQGTDLMGWIRGRATDRFGFTVKCRVYREIKGAVGMLLEGAFT
jgi:hypothetical protein